MARRFPLLLLLLVAPAPAAEVTVSAARSGDVLQVEARAKFEGDRARTWRVLTDYGRLADFVPDLHARNAQERVLLRYSGRVAPDFPIPPLAGTFLLRRHVELTFGALVGEIERRQAQAQQP